MKINYSVTHGLLVNSMVKALELVSKPLDYLHYKLKRSFIKLLAKNTYLIRTDIEGLFIEIWDIFWTLTNIFIFLPFFSKSSIHLWIYIPLILLFCSRSADLLKVLFVTNLNLSKDRQRSLSRSFILLALAFFELAAISTSIQFIICKYFTVDGSYASWNLAYFYSLRNMVTIGGGDITPGHCISSASLLFGIIRILQPLLSVLLVACAINNIFGWRQSNNKRNN